MILRLVRMLPMLCGINCESFDPCIVLLWLPEFTDRLRIRNRLRRLRAARAAAELAAISSPPHQLPSWFNNYSVSNYVVEFIVNYGMQHGVEKTTTLISYLTESVPEPQRSR